jgi:hypothetical protein
MFYAASIRNDLNFILDFCTQKILNMEFRLDIGQTFLLGLFFLLFSMNLEATLPTTCLTLCLALYIDYN